MNVDRFLIRDDEVQVDKAIYFMRYRIAQLSAMHKDVEQENKQLKNRPDTVYDPPKKGLVVKRTKGKINMDMPVEKWNTHHFLRLFQELYNDKYEQNFNIGGKHWEVFSIRISQFRNAHEEIKSNSVYKEMIEWLFAKKFNKKFIATIPLISSDTMLYQWLASTKSQSQTDPEKFKQLAAQTPKSTKDLAKALEDAF